MEYLDSVCRCLTMRSMSLEHRAFFRSGAHWDAAPVLEHLPDGYAIHTHHLNTVTGQMLDTFDGHLRMSGQLLLQLSRKLVLVDLATGELIEQVCAAGWVFADKLESGVIGDRLRKLTTLRAFSSMCAVGVEQRQVVVIDELEKTVVRARTTVLEQEKNHATWMSIEPLRGYDNELLQFSGALDAVGFEVYDPSMDYYPAIGIERVLYTSKPDFVFGWDTTVYDSATLIAQTFLAVARQNEEGILADTDTEFLHDFRVSLRRVRSLLSLFRNVYDPEDCRTANQELAAIMKQTNRLRDLDVYLMDRSNFYALVPDSMYQGLDTLFDIFVRERREALEQVCDFLRSEGYHEIMDDLQRRFSSDEGMEQGHSAGESTGHFASRLLLKRYGKVSKLANAISKDTPDETVHALRIQCKKLRYLMEFFSPLYTQDDIKPLVKSLKGLQDKLGEFNDCSVQRTSLTEFLKQHSLRGKKGLMLAESVGAIVATLYQMQLRARVEIGSSLGAFSNAATASAFKQLVSGGGAT